MARELVYTVDTAIPLPLSVTGRNRERSDRVLLRGAVCFYRRRINLADFELIRNPVTAFPVLTSFIVSPACKRSKNRVGDL
jgi:hypothetical protein